MTLILIVGEAWGETEERWKAPFVGASGIELNEELEDAGFLPSGSAANCNRKLYAARNGAMRPAEAVAFRDATFSRANIALANCVSARPPGNKIERWFSTKTAARKQGIRDLHNRFPEAILRTGIDELKRLIASTRPSLIIVLGGTPLWALTGKDGITRWRSSQLTYMGDDGHSCPLIPTLHPAAVLREWPWRPIVVHDLKRAKHVRDEGLPDPPRWDFYIRTSLQGTLEYLNLLANEDAPLVADVETAGGHITCIGFADSPRRAICIPFLDPAAEDGCYWPDDRSEQRVVEGIKQTLLARPIIFHNGLYDNQIIQADWGFTPRWEHDTMVAQHVAFPGLLGAGIDPVTGATSKRGSSLSLAFCASMYCSHYVFWKDDGRLWDPNITSADEYWRYNCEDCARTFEVHRSLQEILNGAGLSEQYHFQCRQLGPATLRLMRRGLALDLSLRHTQLDSVRAELRTIESWLENVLGHPFNPQSSPQMKALFYEDLRCPPQWKGRGETRALSCDDEALAKIRSARPLLSPLIHKISDYRTLSVLGGKATGESKSILTCRLSPDNRLRTTLNLCGAETFRYSSGPTAHGDGCNLQNILKTKD